MSDGNDDVDEEDVIDDDDDVEEEKEIVETEEDRGDGAGLELDALTREEDAVG